ncbi:MAG: alkaline phosphatase [Hamadaea sp.]|nr:alkaline phosphatase [Hamadaea sp.]NUT24070.1 alkaline phosphatase [Hamadaea sp.]
MNSVKRLSLLACTWLLIGLATPAQAESADPVLVGAGDIAACGSGSVRTAKLLDAIPGTVFTLGDNVYPDGSARNFDRCYDPTWGRHRDRTRPTVGNHDYRTDGAWPYFAYFGASAGDPDLGYYSYDLGSWHVVVVNSNCDQVDCDAQLRWLDADLTASKAKCTVSMWHHPLYTSGLDHHPAKWMRPFFETLYAHGVELNLSGHNHNYERFQPLDGDGNVDLDRGVLPIVVGTGGASHYGFGRVRPHSLVQNDDTYGVLKLTLRSDAYAFEFVPVAGKTFTDSGTGTCH